MSDMKTAVDHINSQTSIIAKASKKMMEQDNPISRIVSIKAALARSCARSLCDWEDESYGIRSKP